MPRFFLCCLSVCFFVAVSGQPAKVVNLRCNYRVSPLGIDKKPPAFSWQVATRQKNFMQSAYRIIIADRLQAVQNGSGNIWNSGKTNTAQSNLVLYRGKPLMPVTKYYWQVQVWNQKNQSCRSAMDSFTTALFDEKDWRPARWIGYEELPDSLRLVPGVHAPDAKVSETKAVPPPVVPLFRKEFVVRKKISRATIYISGLGQYELSLNGKKVGNSFLAPGWTDYDKRVLYNTFDVTGLISRGANAIGVVVGPGFYHIDRERYYKLSIAYGLPKMICKIKIDFADGSASEIVSDQTWKSAPSPITYSNIYGGEDYDARLEQKGWDWPGFNPAHWKDVRLVAAPKGALEPESIYPVSIKDSFDVQKILEAKPGVFIYDFGQNASGIIEVKVEGRKGQTIQFVPSELLTGAGLANQKASGKPYIFSYTLKGDGIESWIPRFTYYGFRYVQVTGAVPDSVQGSGDLPRIIAMRELHNSTSAPQAGSFRCSNDLFNRINTLIKWAIQSNVQSVVTDCPHREKLSWLEQDYLMGGSIHYNLEVFHLYRKLVYDMMDAQTPEGLVPDIAPEYVPFAGGFRDSPEWGSASVILPWLLYKWYGSRDIVEEAYPMMKRYTAYLESKSDKHILSHGLGDWFDYGPRKPGRAQLTPIDLTATAIYYYDLTLLGKMAALIGKQKDSDSLERKASEVKTAFNNRFFREQTQVYATGSQTAMAMPLCVGLVEEPYKSAVFKNLVDSVTLSGKKLTAGDVGYHFLVEALHAGGASQLLYDMNFRDDVPGYGFQLKKGATALTESWPALEEVSNNHLMLGHLMEWFYRGLAGINQADSSVGYRDIVIRPEVVGDLTHVKGTFRSPYGWIVSEWTKSNGRFVLEVSIPANSRATVLLPAAAGARILQDGKPVNIQPVQPSSDQANRTMIKVGSGTYKFEVKSGLM